MDRGAWRAAVHGVTEESHDLVTKNNNTIQPLEVYLTFFFGHAVQHVES